MTDRRAEATDLYRRLQAEDQRAVHAALIRDYRLGRARAQALRDVFLALTITAGIAALVVDDYWRALPGIAGAVFAALALTMIAHDEFLRVKTRRRAALESDPG